MPVLAADMADAATEGARRRIGSPPSGQPPLRFVEFCPVQTPSSLSPVMLDWALKRSRSLFEAPGGVVTDLASDPPVRELKAGRDPRSDS